MQKRVTKKDLAQSITGKGISGAQATEIVDTLLYTLTAAFERMEKIEIRGFGVFTPKVRIGGKRRNPKTGEEVHVADSRVVRFKVSKELKVL